MSRIENILAGTWKGSMILPANFSRKREEESSEFFLRIKYDNYSRAFRGIFIQDPEISHIEEHAKLVGEINLDESVNFEVRYSKFYINMSHFHKDVVTVDNNLSTQTFFEGRLSGNNMFFGSWKNNSTLFEYSNRMYKTMAREGTWWAAKQEA